MPAAPVPPEVDEFLRQPNTCVIATIRPDGSPHTAHTTNLVHLIYVAGDVEGKTVKDGILADVAPTLLGMMGLDTPAEMTGENLVG